MFFSLAKDIHAAKYEHAVIVLDVKANNYLSFIDDAAEFLCFILGHAFTHKGDAYKPEKDTSIDVDECNEWIAFFIDEGIIALGNAPMALPEPLETGGLQQYRWDQKNSWAPFASTSWFEIIRALFVLRRVHKSIARDSLTDLFRDIEKAASSTAHEPSRTQMERLARTVDAATLIYPEKSFCLAWATTFVVLAVRKGWKVNLAFGVQLNPFYAHAWAETASGDVINDDQAVNKVLSVLCRRPYS